MARAALLGIHRLIPGQKARRRRVDAAVGSGCLAGDGRAILVSGSGVYDISNCEDMVKKGEIKWPSQNAQAGLYFAALSSHEIAISHDAKRVYSGLGFAVADIEDVEQPDSWTVKNWSCEMNKQSGFPEDVPNACEGPSQQDVGRQYSHSSDDNLEGTVWYGANQENSSSQMEPPTARMVDISDPNSIEIHPREVAYYNDGRGHVHSGVFHYDEARGIMLASGSQAVHVLMLQPQIIAALRLPTPTDPAYPYK